MQSNPFPTTFPEDRFDQSAANAMVVGVTQMVNCVCFPLSIPYHYTFDVAYPFVWGVFGLAVDVLCCSQSWRTSKTDFSFPPFITSLGFVNVCGSGMFMLPVSACVLCTLVSWQRVGGASSNGEEAQLFHDGIKPSDVAQGSIGNCWLLASISASAEQPAVIENLFVDKKINADGLYGIRLFDGPTQKWKVVTVDSNIPVLGANLSCGPISCGSTKRALSASPQGAELWVSLLEKAFAKHCGSYNAISGGDIGWALEALTGEAALRYGKDGCNWAESTIAYPICANRSDAFYQTTGTSSTNEGMWHRLRAWDEHKFIVCAGTSGGSGESEGIVFGHAYSVIQAREVEGFRLLQVRNPWGKSEWNGPWSDKSDSWVNHPNVATALQRQDTDDGSFWISVEDFLKKYEVVYAVQPVPAQNTSRSVAVSNSLVDRTADLVKTFLFDTIVYVAFLGGLRKSFLLTKLLCNSGNWAGLVSTPRRMAASTIGISVPKLMTKVIPESIHT